MSCDTTASTLLLHITVREQQIQAERHTHIHAHMHKKWSSCTVKLSRTAIWVTSHSGVHALVCVTSACLHAKQRQRHMVRYGNRNGDDGQIA